MHTELSLTCPSQCVTTSGDTFTLHITETGQIPPPVLCVTSREQMERKQVVCDSTASLPLEYSLLLNLTGKHSTPSFFNSSDTAAVLYPQNTPQRMPSIPSVTPLSHSISYRINKT